MWKRKVGRRFQTVEGPKRGLFHFCRTMNYNICEGSLPALIHSPPHEKLHKKCRRGRERGDGEVWGEPSSCEPPQYVMDIDLQTPGSGRWPISAQLPTQLTQLTNHSPASPLSWHSWPTIAQKWQSLGQWIAKPFLHCVHMIYVPLHWTPLCLGHGIFCFSRPQFQCPNSSHVWKYCVYSLNIFLWVKGASFRGNS